MRWRDGLEHAPNVPSPIPRIAIERPLRDHKGTPMDKQRVKGSAQQAKGKIKELAGKAVGNRKLQARGKAEEAGGKVRNTVGGLKDAMRGK
jgi:uncharacterized protein YjbJ (UPF0337 family)